MPLSFPNSRTLERSLSDACCDNGQARCQQSGTDKDNKLQGSVELSRMEISKTVLLYSTSMKAKSTVFCL